MENVKINQKEYLKKYLTGGDDMKKKKKKKLKVGVKTVKIIDDDVDLKNLRPLEDGEFDIFNSTEDAPQIAGIIDERGPVDFTDKRRWKIIADDGEGNIAISSSNNGRDDPRNDEISNNINENHSRKLLETDKDKNSRSENNQSSSMKSKVISDDSLSTRHKSSSLGKTKTKKRHRKASSSSSESTSDSSLNSSSSNTSTKRKNKRKKSKSKNKLDKSKKHDSDLDVPRSSRKHSLDRHHNYRRENDDSDLSPPRPSKKHLRDRYDNSRRQNDDSDLSPPRSSRKHSNNQRESTRHRDSESDLSPPRPSRKHSMNQREVTRHQDKERDFSSPRRSQRDINHKSRDRDLHHVRHNNSDSDLSPPRKSSDNRSRDSKTSRHHDPDLSPPRKDYHMSRHDGNRSSHNRKSRWTDDSQRSQSPQIDKQLKKTLDGKTAGLQSAAALREETVAHKKREAEFFNQMSAEVSGVGRTAILRDRKTGKRRNLEAEAAERREKEKRQEEIDAKYAKWGKGLKQVDDQTEKLKQDLYEMSKPLARYADDVDLDAQLRAVEREGDPMLEYIKQKQIKEGKREPDRPNYQGSYMPNRFGIKPGYRWDGVDRSNGYEKKWFEARNARTAVQEEAYKWSTSDM